MPQNEARPNILLIMTDEQRFDGWGRINPIVKTPNLDRLAQQSIVFTRAYTTNPSCVPARAAMFTGRYPSQCGAPTFITYVNETETTFMSLLRESGYHTAVVGKQHFGRTDIERGYDYEEINDLHAPPKLTNVTDASPSYAKFLASAGFREQNELSRSDSQFRFTKEWVADERYHVDHFIGERGAQWIERERPPQKPWFLWVSFPGPHQPFDGIGLPQADMYSPEDIDMPLTDRSQLDAKPQHYRAKKEYPTGLSEAEIRRMRHSYYAKISLIDQQVGRVLDALRKTGEYDNTLILFTSDHGDFMGDFGLVHKGQYLSEVLMRVPFILKPPVVDFPGSEVNDLVANFDLAATCLSAAGADVPSNMACRDLNPYWRRPDETISREYLYMEASDLRGIRTDRWKMIHYRNRTYGELYDLKHDPWETNNLWDDASLLPIKAQLYSLLINEWIRLGEKSHMRWNVNDPQI
ncbi:MAG: hypothetical protein K0R75_392 [Paenibacillaceae bacterium]|nr:hypothetical protein [Paenibacillaceae bacterium]